MKKITILFALMALSTFGLKAQTTWTPSGNNIYNPNTGNVGIGTTTPNAKLDVNGSIGGTSLLLQGSNGAFIGDGTSKVWIGSSGGTNYIESGNNAWTNSPLLYFTGTGASSGTFAFKGNIGIGTTTPLSKLHIAGSVGSSDLLRVENSNSNRGLKIGTVTDVGEGFIQAYAVSNESILEPLLLNPNGGNVGIGTTTPSVKLTVQSQSTEIAKFSGINNLNYGTFKIIGGTANNPYWRGVFIGANIKMNSTYPEIETSGFRAAAIGFGTDGGEGHIGFFTTSSTTLGNVLNENMRIISNGYVGIGTTTPAAKLHIFQTGGTQALLESADAQSSVDVQLRLKTAIDYRGRGIWMTYASSTGDWFAGVPYTGGGYSIGYHATQPEYKANSALFISTDRNVGIGITNPQNKLDVAGTIRCTEVKVEALPWADFVFHPTYKLRTLGEVEQFIKANNHLPEIPTESEVKQNGIGLGEMNAKLLQKIEELTLYMIEQQKIIEKQNERIEKLEKLNNQ